MSEPEQRDPGCLGRGCFMIGTAGFFFVCLVGLGAFSVYKEVEYHTAAAPETVAVSTAPEEELPGLREALMEFSSRATAGEPAEFSLTAGQLNLLLQQAGENATAARTIAMEMEDDTLIIKASLPLQKRFFMSGRYFNGAFHLRPVAEGEGRLEVTAIHSGRGEVAENRFPIFVPRLEAQLMELIAADPVLAEAERHVEAVRVRDGLLSLHSNVPVEP